MFDPFGKLLLGLVTGLFFGLLLQKGRVAKFQVIEGQLLLRDWTVVKIMLTAVVVGAVGIYVMAANNLISLHIQPALFGAVLVGGAVFGAGMALLGYCPGTCVAACGEGARDAMVGLLGMLVGAIAYVTFYPVLDPVRNFLGNAGKITLPELTETSPWLWIAGLIVAGAIAFWLLQRPPSGDWGRRFGRRASMARS